MLPSRWGYARCQPERLRRSPSLKHRHATRAVALQWASPRHHPPPKRGRTLAPFATWLVALLSLLQHALRIGIADATALASRSRIDRRVDKGRSAQLHRLIDGPSELVGRR